MPTIKNFNKILQLVKQLKKQLNVLTKKLLRAAKVTRLKLKNYLIVICSTKRNDLFVQFYIKFN